MAVQTSQAERTHLLHRSADEFQVVLNDLAVAVIRGDTRRAALLRARMATLIGETMALADLLGRRRTLLALDAHAPHIDRFMETPVVPDVEFVEAVADLVRREPRLAAGAAAVSQLYSQRHAFALARSAELNITERVQKAVTDAAQRGEPVPVAADIIAEIGDWSRAYGETVYRTNVATAYTAGRFQQAFDPEVADHFPAFEFRATMDGDTRTNHAAADGLIAATHDPIWERFSPPLGYNCRCDLQLLSIEEVRGARVMDPNGFIGRRLPATFGSARPDPGFGGGRPDRRLYLGQALGF